jgi:hypothetical protein
MAIETNDETYGQAVPRAFAAVFFLSPLIASIAPRVTPATMVLVAIALTLAARRRGTSWKELIVPSVALFACLVCSFYVLINASWALSPSAGYTKAFLLLGIVLLVFASATAASTLDERQTYLAAVAFVAGAGLGALYLLIEVVTDGAILRFTMNALPAIRPDDTKRVIIVHGEVRRLKLGALNQNVTLVMLHFWPGILMLMALARAQRRMLLITLFAVISAAAILLSEHDSSQVALLGSALAFLVAWRRRQLAIGALAVIWCLAFAAILPLSFAAYNADLVRSGALPFSYKERILIWEYTAERALEHPWLGVGVRSTRQKDVAHVSQDPAQDQQTRSDLRRYTGHHGHSLFVQTWYELGAVGAVLLAVAGALVALRTCSLPREAQPFGAATFASFATIAAFAWGAWQTWWMSAAALAAMFLCVGASSISTAPAGPAREPEPRPSSDAGS